MFSLVRSSARASALLLAHLYLRPLLYARAYRLSFFAFLLSFALSARGSAFLADCAYSLVFYACVIKLSLLPRVYSRLSPYTRAHRPLRSAFLAVVRFKRAQLGVSC